MEGALFFLNSHACISQRFQNQRHVLHVFFIGLKVNKNIIEVGEYEYIEI
jgi:hypothetical protein